MSEKYCVSVTLREDLRILGYAEKSIAEIVAQSFVSLEEASCAVETWLAANTIYGALAAGDTIYRRFEERDGRPVSMDWVLVHFDNDEPQLTAVVYVAPCATHEQLNSTHW